MAEPRAALDVRSKRKRTLIWALCSLLAGLVALTGLRLLRDYPWQLALFSGIPVGVLTFTTLHTLARLREQLRERRW